MPGWRTTTTTENTDRELHQHDPILLGSFEPQSRSGWGCRTWIWCDTGTGTTVARVPAGSDRETQVPEPMWDTGTELSQDFVR
jgi:hypothetical protein